MSRRAGAIGYTATVLGEVVGGYRLEDKLGEGGMGVVYRATHTVLGKPVAIKMMRPQLCADEESVKRFFNEAVLTAQMRHPGIVEIFDYGLHESGSAFIAMALLDGESLETRLERRRALGVVESLRIARQIASALGAAHQRGVIHRDLKPDNVFLTPDPDLPGGERIQLLDFGIAKLLDEEEQAASLTQTGTIIGTPLYMSPEQFRGRSDLDGRTDLYALGCMLYRMLAGAPPFTGESPLDVAAAHIRDRPPPLDERRPGLAAEVAALTEELLAKDRDERPASAAAVRERLEGLLATLQSGAPGDAPPPLLALPAEAPATDTADRPSLELAETVAGDSDVLSSRRRRSRLRVASRIALALALAGLVAAALRWKAAGQAAELAVRPPVLDRCDGLSPEACLGYADLLARGDGVPSDRDRAAALARSACEAGSPRGCWEYLSLTRIYATPVSPVPDIGVDDPLVHVVVVTDFESEQLESIYRRLGRFEREHVGKVGIHLIALPLDSPSADRAARAACVAARHGAFPLFASVRTSSGERVAWTERQLRTLADVRGLDPAELRADYAGQCAELVAGHRRAYRWFDIRGTTAFVAGRRLDGPFTDEALAGLVERRIRELDDQERRIALKTEAIPSTVRFPVPAGGADPVAALLVDYCDPATPACRTRARLWEALEKTHARDFDIEWRPVVAEGADPREALALCAASHQDLALELSARLFDLYLATRRPPTDLRQAFADIGGDLSRFDADLAGRCPEELEAHRAELERYPISSPTLAFVNGRPAHTPELVTVSAMVREEIQLARLLGFGTTIAPADYHRYLVTDPPADTPPFSRPLAPAP